MTTPPTASDVELLRQMRGGAAPAFAALFRRHQGPLFRFAVLRCGSTDTAADIVQEVFMGLLSGRFQFDPLRGQLQHFAPLGVAVTPENAGDTVKAEMLVAADGEPLALRLSSIN